MKKQKKKIQKVNKLNLDAIECTCTHFLLAYSGRNHFITSFAKTFHCVFVQFFIMNGIQTGRTTYALSLESILYRKKNNIFLYCNARVSIFVSFYIFFLFIIILHQRKCKCIINRCNSFFLCRFHCNYRLCL